MHAAERVIDVLSTLRCTDAGIQDGLDALRAVLIREWRAGTPWRAEQALDVIMALDMPAWAVLVGLLSECPVMHAAIGAHGEKPSGMRSIAASDFAFIAEHAQIETVGRFLNALPRALGQES